MNSIKSILVALALLLGATMVPSASQAQTIHVGGGIVKVRDGDHRWRERRGDYRGSRYHRREHRRGYYRDRSYGSRHYRGSRYDRRGFYGDRRHGRDRYYSHRRHHRGNSIVIRLR